MKVQVVSDLHLEFADFDLKSAGADVLVLSGDILIAKYFDKKSPQSESFQKYNNFLNTVSERFNNIVYVAGNHEFYGGKWSKTLQLLENQCSNYPNIHFLNCNSVVIDDVTFIGATLWTDANNLDPLTVHSIRYMMSDYKAIVNDLAGYRHLTVEDTIIKHRQDLAYIKKAVSISTTEKVVCVTHHAPSFASIAPRFISNQLMNGAFASNLDNFILDNPKIKLWAHGHTHDPLDYKIGGTRVVCNARGYWGHEKRADNWQGDEAVIRV